MQYYYLSHWIESVKIVYKYNWKETWSQFKAHVVIKGDTVFNNFNTTDATLNSTTKPSHLSQQCLV